MLGWLWFARIWDKGNGAYLEMTSEINKYIVHFELSSVDGDLLTNADFNNLERKDLRNCSSLNICFEPEEISISDVKITKMLIHYDGLTDSPQDYFGFEYEHDLDKGFKGSPSPIVTFELNKEVDPDEFRKSIWMSSICIFPEKVRERNGEAAFQQDNNGYTSIIDGDSLDEYISQLAGAAIVPPKEISFPDGLDGYFEFELKELIRLNKPSQNKPSQNKPSQNKPSQRKSKKTTEQLLRELEKYPGSFGDFGFLKREADKSLKSDREFILAAIKISADSFMFASQNLRSDREIALAAVSRWGPSLEYADKELKSDREIVLAAVSQDGLALEFACQKFQYDREIVLAAVSQRGDALQYAYKPFKSDREIVLAAFINRHYLQLSPMYLPANLKSDRDFFFAAVRQNGKIISCVSKELKSDREFVLAAVMNDHDTPNDSYYDGIALKYADKKFKSDRELVLAAVSQLGSALKYADKKFKSDREIVLAAVNQLGSALQFADKELKSDREIVLAAVSQDGSALQFACKKFNSDREIVLAAVSQNGSAQAMANL